MSSGWSFKRRPGTRNARGTQHGSSRTIPAPASIAFRTCDRF